MKQEIKPIRVRNKKKSHQMFEEENLTILQLLIRPIWGITTGPSSSTTADEPLGIFDPDSIEVIEFCFSIYPLLNDAAELADKLAGAAPPASRNVFIYVYVSFLRLVYL
jgi:hypothetical protein